MSESKTINVAGFVTVYVEQNGMSTQVSGAAGELLPWARAIIDEGPGGTTVEPRTRFDVIGSDYIIPAETIEDWRKELQMAWGLSTQAPVTKAIEPVLNQLIKLIHGGGHSGEMRDIETGETCSE